jgi:CRP-like cAMP-binding protein
MHELLASHPFFDGLDQVELVGLETEIEELPADVEVIHAGARADSMRFLLSGRIALTFGGALPQSPFETIGSGDVLGVSWVRPEPVWEFTARTLLPTRCVRVDADSLRAAIGRSSDLRLHLMERLNEVLLERLHAVRLQHLDLYRNPYERH